MTEKIDKAKYRQLAEDHISRLPPTTDTYEWTKKQLEKGIVVFEKDGRRGVVLFGDRYENNRVFAVFEDNPTQYEFITLWSHEIIAGSKRTIWRPTKVFMGKTSLMGHVAHGIRSGRTFRGR